MLHSHVLMFYLIIQSFLFTLSRSCTFFQDLIFIIRALQSVKLQHFLYNLRFECSLNQASCDFSVIEIGDSHIALVYASIIGFLVW